MGMAALSRFCTAVFLAAALSSAALAGKQVSTEFGTSYYRGPTFRGGSNQTTNYGNYRALPDGRVQQRVYGSVTINATRVKTPWYGTFGWTKATVQRATKAALRGAKASGWGIVAGLALEKILEDAGFFEENGEIYKSWDDIWPDEYKVWKDFAGNKFASPQQHFEMLQAGLCKNTDKCKMTMRWGDNPPRSCVFTPFGSGDCGHGVYLDRQCPGYMDPRTGSCSPARGRPITEQDINNLDLSGYQPNDDAVKRLRPYLGRPDTATYDPIPPYTTPTETTANPDGSITETTSTHDSQITPQDGPYTSSPGITTHTVSRNRDYKDGQLSGEHTSESQTEPPPAPEGSEGNESGTEGGNEPGNENGGQSGNQQGNEQGNQNNQPQPQPQNIPTDCDFFPTLCAWLEWTKQEPPEEPELEQLKPVEGNFDKKANISFGSKTCPQPVEVSLTFFGNRVYHIDFAPFCRIAEMFYYFVMAMAYFVAARILVGEAK